MITGIMGRAAPTNPATGIMQDPVSEEEGGPPVRTALPRQSVD